MPNRPSDQEQEYFAKLEADKKRKLAEQQSSAIAAQQREELKKLHWMRCPKCGMELQTITHQKIEIDRCFSCNGTWLDAGELEKIAGTEGGGGVVGSILRIFK